MRKLVAGVIVLILAIVWEALVQWSLIAQLIGTLRVKGDTGILMADFITSPILRLAICVVGLSLAARGIYENRVALRSAQIAPTEPQKQIINTTPVSIPPARESARAESVSHESTPTQLIPFTATPSKPQIISATVEDLQKIFDANTSRMARVILEPYFGKWMRIPNVIVIDVLDPPTTPEGTWIVTGRCKGKATLIMQFKEKWGDSLSIVKPGDSLDVIGQIQHSDILGFKLTDCALIQPLHGEFFTRR